MCVCVCYVRLLVNIKVQVCYKDFDMKVKKQMSQRKEICNTVYKNDLFKS